MTVRKAQPLDAGRVEVPLRANRVVDAFSKAAECLSGPAELLIFALQPLKSFDALAQFAESFLVSHFTLLSRLVKGAKTTPMATRQLAVAQGAGQTPCRLTGILLAYVHPRAAAS
jgi:hypothetical protein